MSPQVHIKQDCKILKGLEKHPSAIAKSPNYTHTHALHQATAFAAVLPKTSHTNEAFGGSHDSTK